MVAEFFHLDWTSKARRRLGVPILHLLEHENFDEQAEGYGNEGITGLCLSGFRARHGVSPGPGRTARASAVRPG